MKESKPITTYKLFDAVSVTASSVSTSVAVDLRTSCPKGLFSVQYAVSGDGTVKFEYNLCSTENGNYVQPSTSVDIKSNITKTSGPGADGKDFLPIEEPELAPFMKIVVTETGAASTAVVSFWLNVQ